MKQHIQDKDWFYTFLRYFVDWSVRSSFSKYQVEGIENLPEEGSIVIWASNHTNALMDPMVMLPANKIRKVFVARADIFKKKWAQRPLYFLRVMPIYRIRDGINAVKQNNEAIDQATGVILDGVPFIIFPEATHRAKHSLLKLSKGIFHIAENAIEKSNGRPVYIQPIGIEYSDYFRFRGKVLVRFGKPICVNKFLEEHSDEPAPEGLKITRMLNAVNPFSWIATGRYIRKQRPDLLITKFWLPFMAPALGTVNRVAKRKGLRRVSILDNLVPHEKRPGDRLFANYFVRSVDGMVAMSRSVLADADLFDPKKRKPRTFCPHPLYDHYGAAMPVEEARKAIGLPTEGRYVLFFGFIRDYKGLVAGEFYNDAKPYHDLIARLDIGSRVALHTDFIPDSEVNRYFCAADIVAQPYKSATQSGVTQIAFHFEKPMLVTNVGGLPEIVPDGKVGFVVEPDAQQIADALVRYYTEDWQARLTEGCREEKKKYAWDKMTEAINNL